SSPLRPTKTRSPLGELLGRLAHPQPLGDLRHHLAREARHRTLDELGRERAEIVEDSYVTDPHLVKAAHFLCDGFDRAEQADAVRENVLVDMLLRVEPRI